MAEWYILIERGDGIISKFMKPFVVGEWYYYFDKKTYYATQIVDKTTDGDFVTMDGKIIDSQNCIYYFKSMDDFPESWWDEYMAKHSALLR